MRKRRLRASLGGLIGPCSKLNGTLLITYSPRFADSWAFEHDRSIHSSVSQQRHTVCRGRNISLTARSFLSLETRRTQSFQMQKDSLPPKKRHRLKQTWIALSRKNELVLFSTMGSPFVPMFRHWGSRFAGVLSDTKCLPLCSLCLCLPCQIASQRPTIAPIHLSAENIL